VKTFFYTILCVFGLSGALSAQTPPAPLFPSEPRQIAPDVWFQQVNGSSNCSWVVFDDYVFVIDANFAWVAQSLEERIRKTTTKPIRFVFDTHNHGDHAEANSWWIHRGAEIVCHENCLNALKEKGEAEWQAAQNKRPEFANIPFRTPSVSFPKRRVFEDAHHKLELIHFGWGHTKGDSFVWMEREKIVFSGDACVNGPFNYMGEADSAQWIDVLNEVEKLPFQTLCPGHGPLGNRETLLEQRAYFAELRRLVGSMIQEGKNLSEISRTLEIPRYEKWAGRKPAALNIQKVFEELSAR
jgi:glyoxylase-like metal-dependent hydrolase (beta-lactamase superfamily II)